MTAVCLQYNIASNISLPEGAGEEKEEAGHYYTPINLKYYP